MKIFVTGTRGIPDIPGGIEKHCQEIYPLIAAMGHEVVLTTRSPYVADKQKAWKGIRLVYTYAPRKKSLEAIIHTFISVLKARIANPDIVHIHAVGPSLLVPFARLMGLKVVVTNHGPDYNRQKWGRTAKHMLRLGEYLGGRFAHEVIVISRVIADIIDKRCGRTANLIYNGVHLPQKNVNSNFLDQFGVTSGHYILAVARFVPEKGLHDLIDAFINLDSTCKLVIVGDADYESEYSKKLCETVKKDNRIILTGYITGEPLSQLYSHARLFVLPSYHEGLPIALLEAMSYGLSVLVSDIPANKEVTLPADRYFKCGEVADLQKRMAVLLDKELTREEKQDLRNRIVNNYNWLNIAKQTVEVYKKTVA